MEATVRSDIKQLPQGISLEVFRLKTEWKGDSSKIKIIKYISDSIHLCDRVDLKMESFLQSMVMLSLLLQSAKSNECVSSSSLTSIKTETYISTNVLAASWAPTFGNIAAQ
jgi:hypothetical protein